MEEALLITDMLKRGPTLSFEVFPPKKEDDTALKGIYAAIARLAGAKPDFISVTFSTAGRNRERGIEIADFISMSGLVSLSHITAAGFLREDVDATLDALEARGVRNLLALRGDIPPGVEFPRHPWKDFRYAADLIRYMRPRTELAIGAACYPEGHPECPDPARELEYLKAKEDAGAGFLVTQLFFDTEAFLRFRDRARKAGIGIPIVAGIMPVSRSASVRRLVELSGCALPDELARGIAAATSAPEALEELGIAHAASQLSRLRREGAEGIHLYTMNRPALAMDILARARGGDE